jgi:hypothetical protein
MTSTARVLLGFAVVSTSLLSGSFQLVGAQSAGEAGTTSEPNLQEPAPSSEAAPEEPALQLKLDDAGVEVVPSPPRTADGYTLEEMDLRVRRARIGLISSAGAFVVGGVFFGIGVAESINNLCFSGQCAPAPNWVEPFAWTGTVLLVGGFAGMIISGVLYRRRKNDRDSLGFAHYGRPHRVQWDLARSRLVF